MILPLVFLVIGVLCGRFVASDAVLSQTDLWITLTLSVVIFTAGIDVGAKKIIFRKLAQYRAKILLIPLGTAIGSIIGGLLLGLVLGIPIGESAAIASGFGYYSLTAGLITGLGGAQAGALAFSANVLREFLALLLIPIIAKYFGPYCAIAPGGATSMDTTLGIIARSTNEEATAIAMLHGVVLSVFVPFLVPFLYRL